MDKINLSDIARQSAYLALKEEHSLLLAQLTRLETDNANLRERLRHIAGTCRKAQDMDAYPSYELRRLLMSIERAAS